MEKKDKICDSKTLAAFFEDSEKMTTEKIDLARLYAARLGTRHIGQSLACSIDKYAKKKKANK